MRIYQQRKMAHNPARTREIHPTATRRQQRWANGTPTPAPVPEFGTGIPGEGGGGGTPIKRLMWTSPADQPSALVPISPVVTNPASVQVVRYNAGSVGMVLHPNWLDLSFDGDYVVLQPPEDDPFYSGDQIVIWYQ